MEDLHAPSLLRAARARCLHGIYAIVEPERGPLEPFVAALLAGGIRLFQIRAKGGIGRERVAAITDAVRRTGGVTLVNDDIELAAAADGFHLGQEDALGVDLVALRRTYPDALVGISCGTPAEARAVDSRLCDYIGVGPIFATASKADAGAAIGVDGVRAAAEASALPTAAIGGITLERLADVRASGASMAAIISALTSDPQRTARAFVQAWSA